MSNLEKFKEAIKKAKENKGRQEGLQFEFEGVEPGSWSDFLIKTDIGQIIAQNSRINFKDSYGRRTRGAFIKIDENTFAQVSLLGSGRTDSAHVGITFFPKEELDARTNILIDYDNPNCMRDLQTSRKILSEFKDFDMDNINKIDNINKQEEIWIIESEEDAKNLIDKLGIPKSEEQLEYILKQGIDTRDSCLLTYASMLCEQTPQGNEYVDELIALSVQNCEAEHIPRLIRDYESGAKGIHSAAERGYNRNPNISGISFGRFAGVKNTYGQMPLNFERRKRVMLAIYRGMIKNPNIEIDQLRIFIDTYNFDENDPVAENFIENQFDELQIALQTGECKFTIKELLERSKKRFGISAEELEKRLDDAESRLTDKSKEMITNITNRRRQVLKEIVNGDRKYDSMKLTTKDLETILELYLVDEKKDGKTIRETGMIPSTIRNMPEFKNIVIDYAKNNPPNERMRNLLFSPISSVLDEGIFEDKEFMEKVKEDYGEDSSARISEAVYYKMRHELDDKDFLAKKLDFIEELVEQTNDVGILQGILHIIDKENLQNSDFVDRIFSISTDLETISIIVDKAHRSAFKNPEFLNTILAQTTDQKVIEEVLSRMSNEDKINPEIMLGIIENCPNVLEVFKEKYDNWKGKSNLFYKLTSNEEFQKGLFNIIQNRIQQSEITTRYKEERFESIRRYL